MHHQICCVVCQGYGYTLGTYTFSHSCTQTDAFVVDSSKYMPVPMYLFTSTSKQLGTVLLVVVQSSYMYIYTTSFFCRCCITIIKDYQFSNGLTILKAIAAVIILAQNWNNYLHIMRIDMCTLFCKAVYVCIQIINIQSPEALISAISIFGHSELSTLF